MQTDRYPDTIHKKFQTASSIPNASSEALDLVHILIIHVSMLAYEQALRLGMPPGHSVALSAHSKGAFLLSLLCLTGFASQFEGFYQTLMASDYMSPSMGSP